MLRARTRPLLAAIVLAGIAGVASADAPASDRVHAPSCGDHACLAVSVDLDLGRSLRDGDGVVQVVVGDPPTIELRRDATDVPLARPAAAPHAALGAVLADAPKTSPPR